MSQAHDGVCSCLDYHHLLNIYLSKPAPVCLPWTSQARPVWLAQGATRSPCPALGLYQPPGWLPCVRRRGGGGQPPAGPARLGRGCAGGGEWLCLHRLPHCTHPHCSPPLCTPFPTSPTPLEPQLGILWKRHAPSGCCRSLELPVASRSRCLATGNWQFPTRAAPNAYLPCFPLLAPQPSEDPSVDPLLELTFHGSPRMGRVVADVFTILGLPATDLQ